MLSVEPKISDLVRDLETGSHDRSLAQLAQQLEAGCNQFRSAEVHVITKEVADWEIGVPSNRQLRGFGNDAWWQAIVSLDPQLVR